MTIFLMCLGNRLSSQYAFQKHRNVNDKIELPDKFSGLDTFEENDTSADITITL